MSLQDPIIEFIRDESPAHCEALIRRKRRAFLRLHPMYRARWPNNARLVWAALGALAGVVMALVCVVGVLVYMISSRPAERAVVPNAAATATDEQRPVESSTSSGDSNLNSKGYILPVQTILVSPKVSGIIVKLCIREGSHVKKGDVLAELEDTEYKTDIFRAQFAVETARQQLSEVQTSQPKEIGQAESEIEQAKLELAQLQADFVRTEELFSKQAASKTEYESAGTKFHAAEEHVRSMDYALGATRILLNQKVATAHTQLEQAEAELAKVRWRLDCCTVRAPNSGTILKKTAEEGSLATSNASICELADLAELEVELPIPEVDIRKIKPGQRCRVRTDAFPDRIYVGTVSRVMPVANRVQSAIPIRVKITVPHEEEGIYLKPEMIAHVSFQGNLAIARLNEAGKVSGNAPLRRPCQVAPLSTRLRSLPACG